MVIEYIKIKENFQDFLKNSEKSNNQFTPSWLGYIRHIYFNKKKYIFYGNFKDTLIASSIIKYNKSRITYEKDMKLLR